MIAIKLTLKLLSMELTDNLIMFSRELVLGNFLPPDGYLRCVSTHPPIANKCSQIP